MMRQIRSWRADRQATEHRIERANRAKANAEALAALLTACEELEVRPAQALMVGDSLTDVLAARAAGLAVVCVPYGYNEGADPRALPCDAFVESVGSLPALLTAADCPIGVSSA